MIGGIIGIVLPGNCGADECKCYAIQINDDPPSVNGGLLGPIAFTNQVGFGFNVTINSQPGNDISKCTLRQTIFTLTDIKGKGTGMKYFLHDLNHTKEEINERTYKMALTQWLNNAESLGPDMDNSSFFPEKFWNKHGQDWVKYTDTVGRLNFTGDPSLIPNISPEFYEEISQRVKVKVGCKGTDSKEIASEFWYRHVATSDGNAWKTAFFFGPHPTFPIQEGG